MNKLVVTGVAAAALFSARATVAQTVQSSPEPQISMGQSQTRADMQARIATMFIRLDTNHDGFITKEESAAGTGQGASAQRGQGAGSGMGVHRGIGGRVFDMADVNRDGRVSLAEIQQAVLQRFDATDLDHDGTVTATERAQARAQRDSN